MTSLKILCQLHLSTTLEIGAFFNVHEHDAINLMKYDNTVNQTLQYVKLENWTIRIGLVAFSYDEKSIIIKEMQ